MNQIENFPINHNVETFVTVDGNDIDKLVHAFYGGDYGFAEDMECRNPSQHEFEVYSEELTVFEFEEILKYIGTGRYNYITSTLLKDLCNHGILPPCTLLVKVSW